MPGKVSDTKPALVLQAEKVLPVALQPHSITYCSRTDLIAATTAGGDVDVFRIGGQRAFTVKHKASAVDHVQWIRGGRMLATAYSDGSVDLASGDTGKVVRHVGEDAFSGDRPQDKDRGKVMCIGWSRNYLGLEASNARSRSVREATPDQRNTEDWLADLDNPDVEEALATPPQNLGQEARSALISLPQRLAMVAIDAALPKLSPIPVKSKGTDQRYDVFSSQSTMDVFFNASWQNSSMAVDVITVGYQDGSARMTLDDTIENEYHGPGSRTGAARGTPILHSSHPLSRYQTLVRANIDEVHFDDLGSRTVYRNLSLDLFSLPLTVAGSPHTHLIITYTAKLRDLCAYVTHGMACVLTEWEAHTLLPSRFMESINETLSEKAEGALEQNLYHLAMTGHYSETMIEWLRDELAERGHKRWDHAMTTLYHSLGQLFQVNILPALERLTIVATNLRGLAKYYEGSQKFDVPPEVFTRIIDAVGCVMLIVSKAVQILGEEQRLFRAFSKWLRHQIDIAAADPSSSSALEMAEREAVNLDYPKILAYLEGPLTDSRLRPIVSRHKDATGLKNAADTLNATQSDVVQAMNSVNVAEDSAPGLNSLGLWMHRLRQLSVDAHNQIKKWQSSTWTSAERLDLDIRPMTRRVDVRMTCDDSGSSCNTLVLAVPFESQDRLTLYCVTATSSPSSPTRTTLSKQQHTVSFPEHAEVLDVKFLDDETVIILLSTQHDFRLLHLHYNAHDRQLANGVEDLSSVEELDQYTIHVFAEQEQFEPLELVTNERKGMQSILVLGKDCKHWKIFDLEPRRGRPGFGTDGQEVDSIVGEQEDGDSMVMA